jgi:hypothetical protein
VTEWLDLERNAAILEKTDKAIAKKLRGETGELGRLTQDQRVRSAAQVTDRHLRLLPRQVLLEAGDTISDSEIDSILGIGGVDDGLSEEEV